MRLCVESIGFALCIFLFCGFAGCNRSPYELAEVSGSVLLDGKPLPKAKVMFAPVEVGDAVNPGKPAFGLLQPDGSFALTTYAMNDGAVVGEHWVTIINLQNPEQPAAIRGSATPLFSRISLPTRVRVQAGQTNRFDLKVTADDVRRYGSVVSD
jgi:hypothetical protein